MKNLLAVVLIGCALPAAPAAADVTVLSAGAVEPGLHAFAQLVARETGHTLTIQFNTAPQIARRLAAGEVFDLLISPPAAMTQAVTDGRVVAETRVAVGRVGVGIVVRAGRQAPDVTTVDAFRQAVLSADTLVYNTASTGLYLDKLFAQMGIAGQVAPKSVRYPNGESVMEHLMKATGSEIGFGAITEVRMFEPKGLRLVGPLPAEVQNYTSYEAALMTGAATPDAARAVLRLLASPAGKAAFASRGVE